MIVINLNSPQKGSEGDVEMMIKIYHLLKEKVIKRANYAFRLEKIEMLYKDPSQSKAFKAEKKEKE